MGKFDLVVSQSQIKQFRTCTQKFHYKYGKGLEPKKKSVQMAAGDVIHGGTEALVKDPSGETLDETLKAFRKKYGRIFEEERDILGFEPVKGGMRIVKRYARHWKDEPLEYVFAEEKLGPITLVKRQGVRIGFVLVPDGVVRDVEKRLWLLERKSSAKFRDPGQRLVDLQSALYVWALRELGYSIEGVLWDEIRLKLPTIPRVLKKGGLSRAKKIDTDEATYSRQIKRQKLDQADYADILKRLREGTEYKFFRRQAFPVKTELMWSIVSDAQRTAWEMLHYKGPVKELGFMCNFCEYRKLCEAELNNLDTDFMIKADFRRRTRGKKKARNT